MWRTLWIVVFVGLVWVVWLAARVDTRVGMLVDHQREEQDMSTTFKAWETGTMETADPVLSLTKGASEEFGDFIDRIDEQFDEEPICTTWTTTKNGKDYDVMFCTTGMTQAQHDAGVAMLQMRFPVKP